MQRTGCVPCRRSGQAGKLGAYRSCDLTRAPEEAADPDLRHRPPIAANHRAEAELACSRNRIAEPPALQLMPKRIPLQRDRRRHGPPPQCSASVLQRFAKRRASACGEGRGMLVPHCQALEPGEQDSEPQQRRRRSPACIRGEPFEGGVKNFGSTGDDVEMPHRTSNGSPEEMMRPPIVPRARFVGEEAHCPAKAPFIRRIPGVIDSSRRNEGPPHELILRGTADNPGVDEVGGECLAQRDRILERADPKLDPFPGRAD